MKKKEIEQLFLCLMNGFLSNHVAHTFGHSFSTFIKIWRFIQINSSFISYIFWAALFTKIILTINIGIFVLCFHPTTIKYSRKYYMVYPYIMFFLSCFQWKTYVHYVTNHLRKITSWKSILNWSMKEKSRTNVINVHTFLLPKLVWFTINNMFMKA